MTPRPTTRPQPQPQQPRPQTRPQTPSQTQPKPATGPIRELTSTPGPDGVRPKATPDGPTTASPTRSVPVGVQRRDVPLSAITPVVRKNDVPDGFDVTRAKQSFIERRRGEMSDAGSGLEPIPGSGSDGDHHDGDHDDHHDGDHDGHHGDRWDIDININIWTHDRYCPSGWWYVYGDYNGDGFTDYVCTNGSYSIYWYGWSGAYWNCSPWYGWYAPRYSYRWWTYSVPARYRGEVYGPVGELVDEPGVAVAPAAQQVLPEAVPLSALEVARLEMSIGNPEVAIEAYRSHLSAYPSDWLAMRELGLAMIRTKQRGDGVAMLSYAYFQDPTLAWDAVPVELFERDSRKLRDSVVDVVGWGHRNPSASAWLAVAVLMQAEGRNGPALKMIERAEGYGLDPAISQEMRSVLVTP